MNLSGSPPKAINEPAPAEATTAVLKPSDPVAEGAQKVSGINFDDHAHRDITVSELVAGMANMGFQASAVAEAVRIINDMVRIIPPRHTY